MSIGIRRRLIAVLGGAVFILLFFLNLVRAFSLGSTSLLLPFGFSSFVALLYVAVGLLVWLYGANRLVAGLLYAHSLCMSYTFIVLVGANQNDPLLSALSTSGSALALAFFYLLLLCFPRNVLREALEKSGSSNWRALALWGYTCLFLVVGGLAALFALPFYLFPSWPLPAFLRAADYGYYAVALLSIVVTLLLMYRRSYTPHERQQYRLFVGGVVAAFVPFLVLTALPLAIRGTALIDGQISAVTGGVLPLALGYSVLRYQLLVFETSIRQAAKRVVGVVALGLLTMIICMVASVLSNEPSFQVIWMSLGMCVLGPAVWWGAGRLAERLFFGESLWLRKRLAQPLINQRLRLDEVAVLLSEVLRMHFETQELALFVFQAEMSGYRLVPSMLPLSQQDEQRRHVVARLLRAITPAGASTPIEIAWIDGEAPVIQQLAYAPRPLLLSELTRSTPARELAKFLSPPDWMHEQDLLIVPIRGDGRLLGILALGLHAGRQRFSGVDFEALDLFLSRFGPILQAALAREQANQQSSLLSTFFVNGLLSSAAHTVSDVARRFAEVAAATTGGGAEIWHYREGRLLSLASVGNAALPVSSLFAEEQADWTPIFHGDHTAPVPRAALPPCLREQRISATSFAWLPLLQAKRRVGILLLTYGRPHFFLPEERALLQAFADHCARPLCSAMDQRGLLHELSTLEQRRTLLDAHLAASLPPVIESLGILAGYLDMLQVVADRRFQPWSFSIRTHAGMICEELTLRLKGLVGMIRVRQGIHHQRAVTTPQASRPDSYPHVTK